VPALVGTLGKAFGCFGAFVAGDAGLVETLVQRARTYIYTTALPPAVAAATREALEVAASESWRRARVLSLARRFRVLAAEAGIPLADSATPIQPVRVGRADAAVAASARLLERGYYVAAIRPPTVPADSSRLRIALSAAHRDADVEGLVAALADALRP
jgi:8-amino-7-oxononanoate synthase